MVRDEDRKRAELEIKLDSLVHELEEWLQVTADGAPMEKHHRQVRRLQGELTSLIELIRAEWRDADVGTGWRSHERHVLDLHRLWDFYRERLALRFVPWLRDYLLLADEYAWAAYRPAQEAAVRSGVLTADAGREPPLVSLSTEESAFSITRGSSLVSEIPGLDRTRLSTLVAELPIPLIGMPWYDLRHAPGVLIIGHEVGHLVFSDFGLAADAAAILESALAVEGPGVRGQWHGWLEEVFCDLYGLLAGGQAYLRGLGDFLLVGGVDPTGDGDARYPSTAARLAAISSALRSTGGLPERLAQRLRPVLDLLDANQRDQAESVGRALIAQPVPRLGGPLTGVLDPRAVWAAEPEAARVIDDWPFEAGDVRTLVAAASLAFAGDPGAYRDKRLADKVLRRAREIQQPGLRFREDPGGDQGSGPAPPATSSARLYSILCADRDAD